MFFPTMERMWHGIMYLTTEENRVKGRKKAIYVDGPFALTRIPQETGDRYLVYRCGAKRVNRATRKPIIPLRIMRAPRLQKG